MSIIKQAGLIVVLKKSCYKVKPFTFNHVKIDDSINLVALLNVNVDSFFNQDGI